MYALFVLIIISLLIAVGFLIAFLWAVKDNQYEDDYTPSVRMLFDDTKQEVELTNDDKKADDKTINK